MIALVACKGKPQDLIVKKWAVDVPETKKYLVAQVEELKKKKPELGKLLEEGVKNFEKEADKANMSIEFKKDGTVESIYSGMKEEATWSMSEDGKTITKTEKNGSKSDAQVITLDKNKLVLKITGKDEESSQTLAFVPAK
ncbi:MAG: hypothetical protein OHK0045_18690 [Raineya sp.]